MKKTFYNLPGIRQKEILEISMNEFVKLGYEKASINTIIKKLKIAKGSFYNYTSSKENLYLHIFYQIYDYTFKFQNNPDSYKSNDLFDRVNELLRFTMDYCRSHPVEYKLLIRSELDTGSSFYPKMLALKKTFSRATYDVLFGNIDWSLYDIDSKEDVIAIFTWLVNGLRDDLSQRVSASTTVDDYENILNERLKLYKDSITKGIYKNK